MTKEDPFNVAKNAFSMYGVFFNNVVEEIGLEQAARLRLHVKEKRLG